MKKKGNPKKKSKRKKSDNTPIVNENEHFEYRLLERYNVKLTNKLYTYMLDLINNNRALYIDSASLNRDIYKIYINSPPYIAKEVIVVYNKKDNEFVTALPKGWFKKWIASKCNTEK